MNFKKNISNLFSLACNTEIEIPMSFTMSNIIELFQIFAKEKFKSILKEFLNLIKQYEFMEIRKKHGYCTKS